MKINTERIDQLQSDLERAEKDYLRSSGWDESSDYPVSYWAWNKTFGHDDFRSPSGYHPGWPLVYAGLTTKQVIRIQRTVDAWKFEDYDER